jgi:hypothetical protein
MLPSELREENLIMLKQTDLGFKVIKLNNWNFNLSWWVQILTILTCSFYNY